MNDEVDICVKSSGFKKYISRFLFCIILIVITAIVTYVFTVNVTINLYLSRANSAYMTAKMSLVKNKLESTYIYDIDNDKMIEGAIKGYVSGLGDKYTQYLTKQELQSLMEATTGNYVGIGVYLAYNSETNEIIVMGTIEGSTGENAGIQAGDVIVKVDDLDCNGKHLEDVVNALKGEIGTNVKVVVKRDHEQMEYNVVRSNVKVKTVASKMITGDIGYIKIASFDEGTTNEFKENYNKLLSDNPKGLVIDFRNNGGGVVSEALTIADTMVEKGKVLLITTDKNNKEHIDKAKENPIINIPVVVLVNGNTASASEILASTLRDNCKFKIVGTKSYGKGVIQSVFSFSDGTAVKVTTNEYFSPNHNVINGEGIKPDVEIELSDEWKNISNIPYENDLQLQKAVETIGIDK